MIVGGTAIPAEVTPARLARKRLVQPVFGYCRQYKPEPGSGWVQDGFKRYG